MIGNKKETMFLRHQEQHKSIVLQLINSKVNGKSSLELCYYLISFAFQ
jgi:hypothetical protein